MSPHSISVITTLAGTGTDGFSGDNGQASSATINAPKGIVIDSSGNVYFNEWGNHCVRKITASTGIITTYAGTGSASYSGDGGIASSAALAFPNGLGIDTSGNASKQYKYHLVHRLTSFTHLSGNLYIADHHNCRIRKVMSSTSIISTLAGTGTCSYSGDNGVASSAALDSPKGVALDTSGKYKY